MHYDSKAYLFESTLGLPEIKRKLDALGPWEWVERDSDRHGDYLSAFVPPLTRIKLYEEERGRYQLDVKFQSEAATAIVDASEMHLRVTTVVLPALGATNVREGEVDD